MSSVIVWKKWNLQSFWKASHSSLATSWNLVFMISNTHPNINPCCWNSFQNQTLLKADTWHLSFWMNAWKTIWLKENTFEVLAKKLKIQLLIIKTCCWKWYKAILLLFKELKLLNKIFTCSCSIYLLKHPLLSQLTMTKSLPWLNKWNPVKFGNVSLISD